MTELCAVSLTTGRIVEIPGHLWTIEPPAEVRRLRAAVHAQMRAIDSLLRECGMRAQLLPHHETPDGALCALGGTAYL